MTTEDETNVGPLKKAVIFQEGPNFRAVAAWGPDKQLDSIEVEVRGADALGALRWESYGFLVRGGARYTNIVTHNWLSGMLIERAERWLQENT